MIHANDGYDVTFDEESLAVGLGYSKLSLGLGVSDGLLFVRPGFPLRSMCGRHASFKARRGGEALKVASVGAINPGIV